MRGDGEWGRRGMRNGEWHPYGSQHTVVLKNIIDPQPMIFYGNWNFVDPVGMSIEQFVFNTTANDTNLEDLHTAERQLGKPSRPDRRKVSTHG